MGLYFADLDTMGLAPGAEVVFTMRWSAVDRWEGTDYRMTII